MKKILLIVGGFALSLSFNLYAQPYFTADYTHPADFELADALYSRFNSTGFTMMGKNTSASTPNLVIDKTSPGGAFGANSWSRGYSFRWNATTNCAAPLQYLNSTLINSASFVEVDSTFYTHQFGVVAATSNVLFYGGVKSAFVSLPAVPFMLQSTSYPGATFGKPIIIQGRSWIAIPSFYITGSFTSNSRTYMYLLEIDIQGALINQAIYDLGSGTVITPHAILVSPFSQYYQNEIVIAGEVDNGSGFSDGFLMFVNPSSLNFSTFTANKYNNSAGDDVFSSMIIATGSTPGYVLGGLSSAGFLNSSNSDEYAWMLKSDPSGTVLWSKYYKTPNFPHARPVDMLERADGVNDHNIYALVGHGGSGNSGMLVMRLDENGNWYSTVSNNLFDHHFLDVNNAPRGVPVGLSLRNSGTNDVGLHIYGNYNYSGFSNNFHLSSCYFNGYEGGCAGLTTQSTQFNSPCSNLNLALTTNTGFTVASCPGGAQLIRTHQYNPTKSNTCGGANSYPGSGNNFRATGLNENSMNNMSIYPNPTSGNITIQSPEGFSGKTKILLTTILGEVVYEDSLDPDLGNQVSVDLKDLGLSTGIYFIKASSNKKEFCEKIIFKE